MDPQVYLLPLCIGLTLLGVIATVLTWRFGKRRGKVVQMAGLTLLPVGLYLSGLLLIVWNFVAAIVGWVGSVVFSPFVWTGVAFIGLAVLLWVIGSILVARTTSRALREREARNAPKEANQPSAAAPRAVAGRSGPRTAAPPAAAKDADPEMDEIEELLRRRGIE